MESCWDVFMLCLKMSEVSFTLLCSLSIYIFVINMFHFYFIRKAKFVSHQNVCLFFLSLTTSKIKKSSVHGLLADLFSCRVCAKCCVIGQNFVGVFMQTSRSSTYEIGCVASYR